MTAISTIGGCRDRFSTHTCPSELWTDEGLSWVWVEDNSDDSDLAFAILIRHKTPSYGEVTTVCLPTKRPIESDQYCRTIDRGP